MNIGDKLNIIIYNKSMIKYIEGDLHSILCESQYPERGINIDGTVDCVESLGDNVKLDIFYKGENNFIELDFTTMERIAKYNKNIEIKNLDKAIEYKKIELEKTLKKLDETILKLEKKESKIKDLKKLIEFLDIEEDESDEWDY